MTLRRLRVRLAVILALLVLVMAVVPLLLWRSARQRAIRDDLERSATEQMEEILRAVDAGEQGQGLSFPAWSVGLDGSVQSLQKDPIEGLPLARWMEESGDNPSFRTVRLDNDEEYLGYVRPVVEGQGFITVVGTAERNDRLDDLHERLLITGIVLVVGAAGLGWGVAGLALRPARKAMADQQGFLADAAHEMRTPLAVIQASSSQALSRPRSTEEYVRSLAEIRSAAERASTGINELLELMRFDSGQAIPRLGPLRLDLLAEEVAAASRPEDGEVVAEAGAPVVVDADMALLRQAVENVVRNAARRASRVDVTVTSAGREGVLQVRDNGPGFDAAILPRVFDRYARGDRAGGMGIGMAIVKAIVVAHGGTVEAANLDGGGACVTMRVPLSRKI